MERKGMRYCVRRAKIPCEGGELAERWLITDRYIPDYRINEWVTHKSMRKVSTGREYAYKITTFLNYLDFCGKDYANATINDVLAFVLYVVHGYSKDLKVFSTMGQISYSTLSKYLTVITEFYKWLDMRYGSNMEFRTENRKLNKNSFMYGQIWNYEYKYIIDRHILKLHGSRKYIKWYTEEEKKKLAEGFLSLRDKAVFMITLEGFRIDEVLSMLLEDYDGEKISPNRSKGYEDGSPYIRSAVLPAATCKVLDEYIFAERSVAETESGRISQYIFINLKKGSNQGKPLGYRAYWEILKNCAQRCGMNPEEIRTHSGRSTKVMEFLECQATKPELNITDALIQYHFGWRSIDVLHHYRDFDNKIIAKAVFDKLHQKGETSNE